MVPLRNRDDAPETTTLPLPKSPPPTIDELKQIVRDELAKYQAQIDQIADQVAEHKMVADA
ncbi:MAG TPA: hypothetical protein VK602_03600 [Phyllobacterium sp.]|nr:hypothetical protein [Phyllobacterium sp.]